MYQYISYAFQIWMIHFFQLAARFPLLPNFCGSDTLASKTAEYCRELLLLHHLACMFMGWKNGGTFNLHLIGTSKAGNISTEAFNNTMLSHVWHDVMLRYSRAQTGGNKDDKEFLWRQQQLHVQFRHGKHMVRWTRDLMYDVTISAAQWTDWEMLHSCTTALHCQ